MRSGRVRRIYPQRKIWLRDGLRSQVYDMDFGPRVLDFGPMVLDFGPTSMILKRLHMSMNACFIVLRCESTLNVIHDSFASQYP